MTFARKNIRLCEENYVGQRTYFVTICCDRRRALLHDHPTVSWLLEILGAEAAQRGFAIHAYCFMPDHLYLLVEGTSGESHLLDFVNCFKQKSAFEYRRRTGGLLWQFKIGTERRCRAEARRYMSHANQTMPLPRHTTKAQARAGRAPLAL